MTPQKVMCARCGGLGGAEASHFGERGWHPCFHCGTEGVCSCDECLQAEKICKEFYLLSLPQEDKDAEQAYDKLAKEPPVCDLSTTSLLGATQCFVFMGVTTSHKTLEGKRC